MCCRAALRFLKRCWQFVAPRGSLSGSVLAVVLLASVTTVHAQVASQAIPNEQYYGGFAALNDGNFKLALEAFRGALSSGIRTGQQRWIDSICYYTMTGEVYYRMGMYAEAKDNFDAALNLVIAFPNWMMRVRFADSITPEAPGAIQGVPWGASRNGARFGHFPNNVQILMGRLDNESVIKQGGVVQPPSFNNISPQEIVRCTVLALYRRQSIMGPVAPYEPITDQVTAVLLQNIAQPNHWSQTWVDSMVGMSFASAGKSAQAVPILKRSLLLAGQYDHPLTSMAYLKLGQIAMETGDMANAMTYFDEATYSAAHFGNLGVLEEAFRGGQIAYLMSGQKGLYPPLVKATSWAKSRGSYLYTSLLLQEAESYAVLGDTQGTQAAVERLLEAKKQLTSRDMNKGEVGARYNLINGMVSYQKFLPAPGDEAIGAALGWAKEAGRADKSSVDHPGSKWLFQIGMADSLYTQGTVSPRVAAELYARLLRDPSPTDWGFDPLESLAVLSVPHVPAYEHWFEAAMQRKDIDTALEVADRTRRHRFLNTQQFGGRLLSLRWILESSPESLDKDAKLQRQDLLSRYPAYAKMSQTARDLFAQIRKSPLAPETNDAQREQAALLAELNKVSQQQEVTLREIAVRREGAAIVFPPLRSAKDIKAALPPKTLLLTFFSTNKQLYAFLISNTRYANWQFNSTAQLDKHCLGLLKSLGNFDKNRELSIAQLSDTSWKQQAKDALTAMLANSNVDLSKGVDELVIVPDSQMWYVPLEALQLGDGANQQSLIEKMRVRYAPTMGLTIPDQKGRAAAPVVAVTLGKLYPRDDAAVSQEAFDQLKKVVPGAMALKGQSWAPTPLLSTLYDGLIAIDDLDV